MQQLLALISESPAGQEKSKRIANTPESSSLMDICTRLTGEAAEVCIAQHSEFECNETQAGQNYKCKKLSAGSVLASLTWSDCCDDKASSYISLSVYQVRGILQGLLLDFKHAREALLH